MNHEQRVATALCALVALLAVLFIAITTNGGEALMNTGAVTTGIDN